MHTLYFMCELFYHYYVTFVLRDVSIFAVCQLFVINKYHHMSYHAVKYWKIFLCINAFDVAYLQNSLSYFLTFTSTFLISCSFFSDYITANRLANVVW